MTDPKNKPKHLPPGHPLVIVDEEENVMHVFTKERLDELEKILAESSKQPKPSGE